MKCTKMEALVVDGFQSFKDRSRESCLEYVSDARERIHKSMVPKFLGGSTWLKNMFKKRAYWCKYGAQSNRAVASYREVS